MPRRATTRQSRSNSAKGALSPGEYINPVEKPQAPAASDSSSAPSMPSSSAAESGPDARPRKRDAQRAMPDQRFDVNQVRAGRRRRQVFGRGIPAPGIAAVENAVGEFVQRLPVGRAG